MKKVWIAVSLAALLTACSEEQPLAEKALEPVKAAETETAQAKEVPKAEVATQTTETEAAPEQTQAPAGVDKTALIQKSKEAMKAMGGQLKGELKAAIKAGGPVAALSVCNEKAPEIAASVSQAKGVQVSRVSLKNRNPNNAPNEWQTAVLNDFEARKAAGEPADKLFHAEVVEDNGQKQFRFVKAIAAGKACLTCHGEEIKPEITAKLKEVYPNDKATGFKEGDLRGAFVVITNLQ